jgi:hypothetical protein
MNTDIHQPGDDTSYAADVYDMTDVAEAAKQTLEQTAEQTAEQTREGIDRAMDNTEFFADITASSSALQQTWATVTQSWITAMLDTFAQTNAMIWSMVNWSGAESSAGKGPEASSQESEQREQEATYH